jgi:hypothetical protein
MGNNMHLVTGFAGKTHVTSADFGAFWAAIIGSGDYVLDFGQKFAATIASDNLIRLADGELLMQGRHGRIEKGLTADLPIENGTADMLRRDLIVARYTKSEETGVEDINPVVILGTPAESSPADPEYITGDILNGDLQRDFPLFRVNLNGATISSVDTLFTQISHISSIETNLLAAATVANTANSNATTALTTANNAPKLAVGSYTGTGTYGSGKTVSLTFGFKPKCMIIFAPETNIHLIWNNTLSKTTAISSGSSGAPYYVYYTQSSNGISWYTDAAGFTGASTEGPKANMNVSGTVYYYIAIG